MGELGVQASETGTKSLLGQTDGLAFKPQLSMRGFQQREPFVLASLQIIK